MLAITLVHPADLVKTRMQLLSLEDKHLSTFAVARRIVKNKGVSGLYAGLSAALLRQALYTGGRLGGFTIVFDWYQSECGTPKLGTKLMIGMMAGIVGAVIAMPAEVALIRMTTDGRLPPKKKKNYRHVFDAIIRMTREEGIMTLTRGLLPTVTRSMVLNGVQLGIYAQAREMILPTFGDNMLLHFCASMISGLATTFATLPVDIVKTRMQHSPKRNKRQLGVLTKIIRNEGVLTLWSGFLPSYAKIGPHTVITFLFFEQLKHLYLGMVTD